MKILFAPFGYNDLNQINNLKGPICESITNFELDGEKCNFDVVVIYLCKLFIKYEKNQKLISRNINQILKKVKDELGKQIKLQIIYDQETNIFDFNQGDNLIDLIQYKLFHLDNVSLKKTRAKLLFSCTSGITLIDFASLQAAYKFSDNYETYILQNTYEESALSSSKIDVDCAINKLLKKSIKVDDNKYAIVNYKTKKVDDPILVKAEKILSSYSYDSLNEYVNNKYIVSENYKKLIDFAMAIIKGNINYVIDNHDKYDFITKPFERVDSNMYYSILTFYLRSYIYMERNDTISFLYKLESLLKESLMIYLYSLVRNKVLFSLFIPQNDTKCRSMYDLFDPKLTINTGNQLYIANIRKDVNKILSNRRVKTKDKEYITSSILFAFVNYFNQNEEIKFAINQTMKVYLPNSRNDSLLQHLNHSSHKIYSFEDNNLIQKKCRVVLHLIDLIITFISVDDERYKDVKKPTVLNLLNEEIIAEILKLSKKK